MCHSPSGALMVQAPDRAWAVADTATATLSPAAIPPDTTFWVNRFITDLRMKGGSTALLHFVATCCCHCYGPKRPGGDWARAVASQEPVGGPGSAPAWSPRALRERVRPEVRLATPPRIHAGRATASGHRAVRKHEANVAGEMRRDTDSDDDEWGRAGL